MKGPTATLANFVWALRFDQLPAEVVDKAKQLILDLLGIALRASLDTECLPSIRAGVDEIARPGEATVAGHPGRLSAAHAALLNGVLAHSLDFDDTHREGSIHPGAVVIPAALALAEEGGLDGRALITAIVAGYEVACRVSMALGPKSHYDRGFHPTATAGHFGATAAASSVLGLQPEAIESAFGINGSQAAGSLHYLNDGSWNKRLQVGLTAHNSVLAAQLARHGFFGAGAAVEGRLGFLHGYTDDPHPERVAANLWERWEIMHTAIKPYPACRHVHGAVDLVAGLAARHDLAADSVDRIRVGICEVGMDVVARPIEQKRRPVSLIDGQFSLPFAVAVALKRRRLNWSDYELVGDPEINRLMDRVEAVSDPAANAAYPQHWMTSVEITAGGRTYTEHRPDMKGEAELPLDWDEVVGKFEGLAESLVDVPAVIAAVRGLDAIGDVRALGALLRPAAIAARSK